MSKRTHYILAAALSILIAGIIALPRPYTKAALRAQVPPARALALTWLVENFTPQTGLFTYALNPQTGEFSLKQNALRQLMASRVLAQEATRDERALALHKVNLEYVLKNWYREDNNGGYVLFSNKSKLGANAMLLRTLIDSPLYGTVEKEARALARGILSLQQQDGSFRAWYVEPSYAYDEAYILTFYSGEALLALVEYYEKTGDETYLRAATRAADFYLNEYVVRIDENYYPAYVPWHSIALNKLYKITADAKYANAIFIMTDKLLEIQDTDTVIGRFYNPATPQYGRPHVASDAVYTEGLTYAYEVAQLVGDSVRAGAYERALWRAVRNLLSLQYTHERDDFPLPAYTYVGGFRTNLTDPAIRVDNVQHAIDALTKISTLFP